VKQISLWEKAKQVQIQTSAEIVGGFNIGFGDKISEETKDALMRFVYWVEDHYHLPVTLWVDFKYNHYLITREKKRVGFRFYWAEFATFPVFEKEEDIPVIELPVRTERSSMEQILTSFIEAISYYFAWLTNRLDDGFEPDEKEVEQILQSYLDSDSSQN